MKGLRHSILPCAIFMVISAFVSLVWRTGPICGEDLPLDVAIVVEVSGKVAYQNESDQKKPAPVEAFMKLCQDDLVSVPEGSQLKLIYVKEGRQENWQGKIVLKIGATKSQVQGKSESKKQPEVETLPNHIRERIVETVLPFSRGQLERGGGMVARNAQGQKQEKPTEPPSRLELTEEEHAEIEAAKETYTGMKKQRGADDMTPELYLLSVFAEYELYDEIRTLIGELLKKYPDNPVLKVWEEEYGEL